MTTESLTDRAESPAVVVALLTRATVLHNADPAADLQRGMDLEQLAATAMALESRVLAPVPAPGWNHRSVRDYATTSQDCVSAAYALAADWELDQFGTDGLAAEFLIELGEVARG